MPPTAAPPPPSKPAAAPAQPATPAAPAKPAASAPAAPTPEPDRNQEAFDELDQIAASGDSRSPAKPELKKEEPFKAEDATTPPPADANKAKPADTKPDDKTPPTDDGKPVTVPELRKNYERVKAENAELKKKLESSALPKDDPEKAALTSKLTEHEKRLTETQNELKFAAYEKSDEYKREFVAPIEAAFKAVYGEIAELTVELADGSTRNATPEDFGVLIRMDLKNASAKAREWFGDLAPEVMAHRRHIIQLNQRRTEALDKFRTESAEREKTRLADSARHQDNVRKAMEQLNKDITEANPEIYGEDENDPDGNKELAEGREVVERAFGPKSRDISEDERLRARAMVWNNTIAFPRMVARNKKLSARVTELETELAQYKASEPGGGTGGAPDNAAGPASWEEELDAIAVGKK